MGEASMLWIGSHQDQDLPNVVLKLEVLSESKSGKDGPEFESFNTPNHSQIQFSSTPNSAFIWHLVSKRWRQIDASHGWEQAPL